MHDGNEDCSLLLNSKSIKEMNCLFDTQIAQRIYFEACTSKKTTKDSNISLKDLLKKHINIVKDDKCDMKTQMNKDKNLWNKRPLNKQMLNYAVEDVHYLEKLYEFFKKNMPDEQILSVLEESRQSIPYSYLNLNINVLERDNLIKPQENTFYKPEISGMIK